MALPPRDERDMSAFHHNALPVFAPDEVDKWCRRSRRDDVVVLGSDMQQRDLHVLKVDTAAAEFERPVHDRVLPDHVTHVLAEAFAGEWHMVGGPAVEHPPGADELVVPEVVPELDLPCDPRSGAQQVEGCEEQLRRGVAERIDDAVDVEPAGIEPATLEAHAIKIHRCGEAGEVAQRAILVEGRIHRGHEAAEAVADDVDIWLARLLHDLRDTGRDAVEDIVFDPQVLVLFTRDAPVDQEDIEALLEQVLHHALAGRQVEDVRLRDKRGHEEDRDAIHLIRKRPVVVELHRADLEDGVFRRQAHRRVWRDDEFEAFDVPPDGAFDFEADALGNGLVRDLGGPLFDARAAARRGLRGLGFRHHLELRHLLLRLAVSGRGVRGGQGQHSGSSPLAGLQVSRESYVAPIVV